MISRTRRFWVGIGSATTLAGVAAGVPAALGQDSHKGHGATPAPGSSAPGTAKALSSPQAGESYLTDGGPKDTRIRIYRDITLMQGHLYVGDELIKQGRWDDAVVHFLHPAEELYGAMERYITLHQVTPFSRELKAQAEAVKAKRMGAYEQNAKVVGERLTAALEKFKTYMTPPVTSFTVRSANEVLKVAASEYEGALEDGKIVNPMEYQDARGFVWAAEQLYVGVSRPLEDIDLNRLGEIRGLINELKTAFPAAMPPQKPVMSAETFSARVSRIEELSSVYW